MSYLTFKDIVDKNGLNEKATINIKIQQIVNTNRRFAPPRCKLHQPKCICEMITLPLRRE